MIFYTNVSNPLHGSQFMNEMIVNENGVLFSVVDMPEPPKESFFKGLFGGGARNLDREELCKYTFRSIDAMKLRLIFCSCA